MAKRGSTKWFSLRQETRVANAYSGKRSPSSGAAVTDAGDVRAKSDLIECKHSGTFNSPKRSISLKLDDFEKIRDEAMAEGRVPVLCLSIYAPGSPMANSQGCVDLSVRLMDDDADMTEWRNHHREHPYG